MLSLPVCMWTPACLTGEVILQEVCTCVTVHVHMHLFMGALTVYLARKVLHALTCSQHSMSVLLKPLLSVVCELLVSPTDFPPYYFWQMAQQRSAAEKVARHRIWLFWEAFLGELLGANHTYVALCYFFNHIPPYFLLKKTWNKSLVQWGWVCGRDRNAITRFFDIEAKSRDYINCSLSWLFKPPLVLPGFFLWQLSARRQGL